jgi:hypothetical protein
MGGTPMPPARTGSRALGCALVAVVALAASPAYADDGEAFFAQGRSLRSQGKCAEAIITFRRAFEVKPEGLGSLRNVAECEEELGQFASARTDWWGLRRAALQSNEPKYANWDKDAEAAYARLEGKVARITIKLVGHTENAQVSIDGKPLDPRLVGVELERDLGPYTVQVNYGAATPVVEHRTLMAGAKETVTLTLPDPALNPAKPGDDVPVAATHGSGGTGMRNAGIALVAIGAASFIGMGISIGVRAGAISNFSNCQVGGSYVNCPPSLMGEESTGQQASTAATALAIIGAAGVAVGVPLIIVGSRNSNAPNAAPPKTGKLSISPTAGGATLSFGVRY